LSGKDGFWYYKNVVQITEQSSYEKVKLQNS